MNLSILLVESRKGQIICLEKDKPIDLSKVTPTRKMKYEIAGRTGT